ncbi:hypothetical protein PoB_007274800 [Plakobranchus ocellatus]|uniref:Uncharacterized protein n=1 Tax=Plakobranchus ocellatus TaxID=259542 RepID=A0AAV4DPL0_9GAST|nr:hypothetical protein PoB_007274800 [Plakobranchus ocellatus]
MVPAVGDTVNRKFTSDLRGVFCHSDMLLELMFADRNGKGNKQLAPKGPVEKCRKRKLCGTDPPPFGGYKASKSVSDDSRRVATTYTDSETACEAAARPSEGSCQSKKKEPAYQREQSLNYLKTVKNLFVFQWHFQIKCHLHKSPCASDVLAAATAVP